MIDAEETMHLTPADCKRLGIDWATGRLVGGGTAAPEPIQARKEVNRASPIGIRDLTGAAHPSQHAAIQLPGRAILPEGSPGRWVLEIPGWCPALDNALVGRHPMAVHRLKTRDSRAVHAACLSAGVTRPVGRRRVRLVLVYPRGRFPDGPAPLKSFHDALVRAGAIRDDADAWLDWGPPIYQRGPKGSRIVLEDV